MFNGKFSGKLEVEKNNQTKFFILASKNRVKDVANVSLSDAFMRRNKYVKTKKWRSIDKTNGSSFTFADNYLLS